MLGAFGEATVRQTIKFRDQKPPKTRRFACSGSIPAAASASADASTIGSGGSARIRLSSGAWSKPSTTIRIGTLAGERRRDEGVSRPWKNSTESIVKMYSYG